MNAPRVLKRPGEGVKFDQIQPCVFCGRGICAGGQIACTRIRVTRLCTDPGAVRRQHGLELMIGSPAIAHAMGPQEEMLKAVGEECSVLVCDRCSMDRCVFELHEIHAPGPHATARSGNGGRE